MRVFSSTLGLIALLAVLAFPATLHQARAETGGFEKMDLADPYRELQYAYANGFQAAVRYILREMKAEKMDLEKLEHLAANRRGLLRDLTQRMAREYQATLIKLNAEKQLRPAETN